MECKVHVTFLITKHFEWDGQKMKKNVLQLKHKCMDDMIGIGNDSPLHGQF